MAMSRCEARLKVTSSPSRRIWPDVGNSRPAIILSVVVLPQPEGPSRQKNSLSRTTKVESLTAANIAEALVQVLNADLGHASHSGTLDTIKNITTPASVVTNE